MIKIFFKDILVVINTTFPPGKGVYNGLYLNVGDIDAANLDIVEMVNASHRDIYMHSPNPERTFSELFSDFQHVDAAGGVVMDEGKMLWIFRNGRWDLPKGKLETGEQFNVAALREVEEECGLKALSITKELGDTFHTYIMNDQWCIKQTKWFEMKGSVRDITTPQVEEGIEEITWVDIIELEPMLNNTYASIREMLISHLPYISS